MLYCVGGGYWNISKSSKADSSVTASGDVVMLVVLVVVVKMRNG